MLTCILSDTLEFRRPPTNRGGPRAGGRALAAELGTCASPPDYAGPSFVLARRNSEDIHGLLRRRAAGRTGQRHGTARPSRSAQDLPAVSDSGNRPRPDSGPGAPEGGEGGGEPPKGPRIGTPCRFVRAPEDGADSGSLLFVVRHLREAGDACCAHRSFVRQVGPQDSLWRRRSTGDRPRLVILPGVMEPQEAESFATWNALIKALAVHGPRPVRATLAQGAGVSSAPRRTLGSGPARGCALS